MKKDLIQLLVLLGVILVMLFYGNPDLWDQLHERAKSAAECKTGGAKP